MLLVIAPPPMWNAGNVSEINWRTASDSKGRKKKTNRAGFRTADVPKNNPLRHNHNNVLRFCGPRRQCNIVTIHLSDPSPLQNDIVHLRMPFHDVWFGIGVNDAVLIATEVFSLYCSEENRLWWSFVICVEWGFQLLRGFVEQNILSHRQKKKRRVILASMAIQTLGAWHWLQSVRTRQSQKNPRHHVRVGRSREATAQQLRALQPITGEVKFSIFPHRDFSDHFFFGRPPALGEL